MSRWRSFWRDKMAEGSSPRYELINIIIIINIIIFTNIIIVLITIIIILFYFILF